MNKTTYNENHFVFSETLKIWWAKMLDQLSHGRDFHCFFFVFSSSCCWNLDRNVAYVVLALWRIVLAWIAVKGRAWIAKGRWSSNDRNLNTWGCVFFFVGSFTRMVFFCWLNGIHCFFWGGKSAGNIRFNSLECGGLSQ